MQLEFVVIDPVLGEVSCEDEAHARDYAAKVGGVARVNVWQDGEITESRDLK
jgi:hypothetical protein